MTIFLFSTTNRHFVSDFCIFWLCKNHHHKPYRKILQQAAIKKNTLYDDSRCIAVKMLYIPLLAYKIGMHTRAQSPFCYSFVYYTVEKSTSIHPSMHTAKWHHNRQKEILWASSLYPENLFRIISTWHSAKKKKKKDNNKVSSDRKENCWTRERETDKMGNWLWIGQQKNSKALCVCIVYNAMCSCL